MVGGLEESLHPLGCFIDLLQETSFISIKTLSSWGKSFSINEGIKLIPNETASKSHFMQ